MNNLPNICQVIASINENTGGPAYSVSRIAQSLLNYEIESSIFTLDYQTRGQMMIPDGVKVYSQVASKTAQHLRGFQPSAYKYLCQLSNTQFDLIHNHGLWMFPNVYARLAAVKYNIPLVISSRGMLQSWSLKYGKYKKILAWILYEKQNLNCATAFHATSEDELKSIRNLGYQQPVALLPNGVDIPNLENTPPRTILTDLFPTIANSQWLLFLSRLHPKKGIDNLLLTWSQIAHLFPDWHLIIAGPDSLGYQNQLEKLTQELQLKHRVTFTGMLSGEIKASALANADLFVLPTHSENFGIVVAESLSYQVPVITTREAPWEDLLTYDCGWWIEDNQDALKSALIEAMKLSSTQRLKMGEKGRIVVEKKYSWDYIGKQMAEVYRWILSGGITPNCVIN